MAGMIVGLAGMTAELVGQVGQAGDFGIGVVGIGLSEKSQQG